MRVALLAVGLASACLAVAPAAPITIVQGESPIVAQRCAVDHPHDNVRVAVATGGYGLCDFSNVDTGGEEVFRIVGGVAIGIGGGGGQMAATDMVALYRVPMATAEALNTLRQSIRSIKRLR